MIEFMDFLDEDLSVIQQEILDTPPPKKRRKLNNTTPTIIIDDSPNASTASSTIIEIDTPPKPTVEYIDLTQDEEIISSKKKGKQILSEVDKQKQPKNTLSDQTNTDEEYCKKLQQIDQLGNTFECKICFDDKSIEDIFIFSQCNHIQCRHCTYQYFESKITSKDFPIKCPHCKMEVTDEDLEMIVSKELFEKYDNFRFQKVLEQSSDYRCCLHPGCQNGVFWNEKDGHSSNWKCDKCGNSWCLKCKDTSHFGTCEDFKKWKIENGQTETKMEELIRTGVVKLCPKCKTPTQKSSGCNYMTCSRCNAAWCWNCGKSHADCNCGKNPHKQMQNIARIIEDLARIFHPLPGVRNQPIQPRNMNQQLPFLFMPPYIPNLPNLQQPEHLQRTPYNPIMGNTPARAFVLPPNPVPQQISSLNTRFRHRNRRNRNI